MSQGVCLDYLFQIENKKKRERVISISRLFQQRHSLTQLATITFHLLIFACSRDVTTSFWSFEVHSYQAIERKRTRFLRHFFRDFLTFLCDFFKFVRELFRLMLKNLQKKSQRKITKKSKKYTFLSSDLPSLLHNNSNAK